MDNLNPLMVHMIFCPRGSYKVWSPYPEYCVRSVPMESGLGGEATRDPGPVYGSLRCRLSSPVIVSVMGAAETALQRYNFGDSIF